MITLKTVDGYEVKDGDNFYIVTKELELKYWSSNIMASFSDNILYLTDKKKRLFKDRGNAESYLKKKKKKKKNEVEWMFTFEGGGWNSVWAINKDEAIRLANEKYLALRPNKDSFMEVEKNKGVYKNYLSLFW